MTDSRELSSDWSGYLWPGEQWFDVWQEGFNDMGNCQPAWFCGRFGAKTFNEAVQKAKAAKTTSDWHGKFFDNEQEARRRYG